MDGGIRLEFGRVQHLEAGREARQLAVGGTQEHVVDEEGVPRIGRHEANLQTERRIRARVDVADK